MLKDSENLKDSSTSLATRAEPTVITYTKTNKLISALFMVTDMIDKDEPIRAKLRNLGMGIVSDVNENPAQALSKIADILSFLDIASSVQMISEMNRNILKKEFINLKQSIKEFTNQGSPLWLEEFMLQAPQMPSPEKIKYDADAYQGHTRIGVQKGSTLMKALSEVEMPARPIGLSNRVSAISHSKISHVQHANTASDFNLLKQQRRDEIIKIIKENSSANGSSGLTISDIKSGAKNLSSAGANSTLVSCSEKTLQRELVSMLKDNVLNKTGEKRWSKYFLPK